MTTEQPIIEIERISIVTAIQGREGSVMAERVMTFAGETRIIAPVNLYVGDFDVSYLPQAVQDALEAIDAQKQARIAELEASLSAMTVKRDSLASEKTELTTQRDSLQSRVAELTNSRDDLQTQLTEATTGLASATGQVETLTSERDSLQSQLETLQARINELENPPNPFPNSDWQGFRSAALASPVIMRMAVSNIGNFMMLLIYLTEMQKDPATSLKMAAVWNEMETKTPLSPEEIAGINALAAHYQVPMVLNSEGQIVLP